MGKILFCTSQFKKPRKKNEKQILKNEIKLSL